MTQLKGIKYVSIGILANILFSSYASAIVIRHDKPEKHYIADFQDFPALATFYNIGVHGTLIAPDWILTATHAVFCLDQGQTIKVGNQLAEVQATYNYPTYEFGGENDLSLVKLKEPITTIEPAQLYRATDETNKDVWFIGSGGTGTGLTGQTVSNVENNGVLRKAQNKVIASNESDLQFVFEKGDAGLEYEGVSGNGDSGGPAYIKQGGDYFILGVSSRTGSDDKYAGEYGVTELYTRVSAHINWIEQVISSDESERAKISSIGPFLHPGMAQEHMMDTCKSISVTQKRPN
ncbi:trypsin-like serine protease [Glaciecola sp. KUL10]|uniref:S1 family peptidase n=1 Tax=Glaciecola sp. (strain KUL10) TaxID=2161813 RepID=UPI000D78C4EB|nr:trypsin-like serine protease [Glaciecola sp. KUL10]GBL05910.1 peptidase S1 and S6, chymotrypsin/Hap [Glaciecola sp. KUL10]